MHVEHQQPGLAVCQIRLCGVAHVTHACCHTFDCQSCQAAAPLGIECFVETCDQVYERPWLRVVLALEQTVRVTATHQVPRTLTQDNRALGVRVPGRAGEKSGLTEIARIVVQTHSRQQGSQIAREHHFGQTLTKPPFLLQTRPQGITLKEQCGS